MGIEPTGDAVHAPPSDFEDRGHHGGSQNETPTCEDAQTRHGGLLGALDPDLARVVERWESIPPAIRAGIVAMVNAASE